MRAAEGIVAVCIHGRGRPHRPNVPLMAWPKLGAACKINRCERLSPAPGTTPAPVCRAGDKWGPCRGGISSARRTKIRLLAQKEPFCRISSVLRRNKKIPHRDKAVTPGIEGRAGWLHWVKRTSRDNVNYAGTARAKHPQPERRMSLAQPKGVKRRQRVRSTRTRALSPCTLWWFFGGRLPEVVRRTASLRYCIPACRTRSRLSSAYSGTALTLIYKSGGM